MNKPQETKQKWELPKRGDSSSQYRDPPLNLSRKLFSLISPTSCNFNFVHNTCQAPYQLHQTLDNLTLLLLGAYSKGSRILKICTNIPTSTWKMYEPF